MKIEQVKKHLGLRGAPATLVVIWLVLSIVAGLISKGNNFLIFRGVFWHTWQELPLYVPYPEEYFDINHYGPLFSLIIAPFALLPVWLGQVLWSVAMTVLLFCSIWKLPIPQKRIIFIYWFCAHELMTALFMNQFNIVIAAIIILSFLLIERERDHWATLLIVIGTLVKIYGIVGIAFFLFSKHKLRFILSFAGWMLCQWQSPPRNI